ncbi:hypothetical protein AKO1_001132 [Acrasis kona]|uniref:Ribosomal protein mS38 C-terminal domain-containing protein n=1 Tax=Acrasis kona TaxID=1008807 RepID=A0AAW2ZBH6_9EUKA
MLSFPSVRSLCRHAHKIISTNQSLRKLHVEPPRITNNSWGNLRYPSIIQPTHNTEVTMPSTSLYIRDVFERPEISIPYQPRITIQDRIKHEVYCDSVKRKRKKKMNRHHYRKRLKKTRSLRRKLGKA